MPVVGAKRNILFICSRNQWRSPTAEKLWMRHPAINVRSAGTSAKARRTVSPADVDWADVIMVMEEKHRDRLRAAFPKAMKHKELHVLDIPDMYKYMDKDLIVELERSVIPVLELE